MEVAAARWRPQCSCRAAGHAAGRGAGRGRHGEARCARPAHGARRRALAGAVGALPEFGDASARGAGHWRYRLGQWAGNGRATRGHRVATRARLASNTRYARVAYT